MYLNFWHVLHCRSKRNTIKKNNAKITELDTIQPASEEEK